MNDADDGMIGRQTPEDAYRSLRKHPGWIVERDRIRRDYTFGSFVEAMAFANGVAALAERRRHHPNIRIHEWCFVELELYSHNEGGISARDVDFALALDAQFSADPST